MRPKDIAVAVVGLAMITRLILPRNNGAELITLVGEANKALIKAANPQATPEMRTNAEKLAAEAQEALDRFWAGFHS
jgi:hypothetical protein